VTIEYGDFEKVEARVGVITEVEDSRGRATSRGS